MTTGGATTESILSIGEVAKEKPCNSSVVRN